MSNITLHYSKKGSKDDHIYMKEFLSSKDVVLGMQDLIKNGYKILWGHTCPHCKKIHYGSRTMRYCPECRKLKKPSK